MKSRGWLLLPVLLAIGLCALLYPRREHSIAREGARQESQRATPTTVGQNGDAVSTPSQPLSSTIDDPTPHQPTREIEGREIVGSMPKTPDELTTMQSAIASSTSPDTRLEAALGLSAYLLKHQDDVATLTVLKNAAVADSADGVRVRTLETLLYHRHQATFVFVLERLRLEPSPAVQRNVIRTLAKIGKEDYVTAMKIFGCSDASAVAADRRTAAAVLLDELIRSAADIQVRDAAWLALRELRSK